MEPTPTQLPASIPNTKSDMLCSKKTNFIHLSYKNRMLIDMLQDYDQQKIDYLLDLWEKMLLHISGHISHNKILAFLKQVAIIDIDETNKEILIGVSNDFVLTQIKKNFNKALKEAAQACYNPQFSIKYSVYSGFTKPHPLLADLNKLLNVQKEKKSELKSDAPIAKSIKAELNQHF